MDEAGAVMDAVMECVEEESGGGGGGTSRVGTAEAPTVLPCNDMLRVETGTPSQSAATNHLIWYHMSARVLTAARGPEVLKAAARARSSIDVLSTSWTTTLSIDMNASTAAVGVVVGCEAAAKGEPT